MLMEKKPMGSIAKLKEIGARKVLLQFPEGLKTRALEIASRLQEAGITAYISCDPCYGACDLKDSEAARLGCAALLHIGHTDFGVKAQLPVVYEEYPIEADPIPFLENHIASLKQYRKISLVTTLQFLSSLKPAKEYLGSKGIEVVISSPKVYAAKAGQILGCDPTAALPDASIDCILYIGSGMFHPLGVAIRTDKPVLSLDFETGELVDVQKEKIRIEKIRYASIEKAREARNFGILVSTKPGQLYFNAADKMKEKLESIGKRAWIIVSDELRPEKLLGMDLDVLVNCACPRLREDTRLFRKPILNPEDVWKL
ncbi:MAG: diphthamide biosynthesis enzyme Dph2 [Candidatus Aenigmarchaeota archaeon]|nr:diphthamide biosynthesis enzyme Dph2 [Candidatus Aenigmarchaeota archaeon]